MGDAMHRSQVPIGVRVRAREVPISASSQSLLRSAVSQVPIPVVGILPWGVVRGVSSELPEQNYRSMPCTSEGVGINSGHTHFIFVDNGLVGAPAWGSEIAFRSALEAEVARIKNVPLVQLVSPLQTHAQLGSPLPKIYVLLTTSPPRDACSHCLCTETQVVQGGPGTLATVESIALAGKPIVRHASNTSHNQNLYHPDISYSTHLKILLAGRAERQRRGCDRGAPDRWIDRCRVARDTHPSVYLF